MVAVSSIHVRTGVLAISTSQATFASRQNALAQTAAFLAGVTAATMALTQLSSGTRLAKVTFNMWYFSLVCAVGAALLSLLAGVVATSPKYVPEQQLFTIVRNILTITSVVSTVAIVRHGFSFWSSVAQ